jgi:hypothetical protein
MSTKQNAFQTDKENELFGSFVFSHTQIKNAGTKMKVSDFAFKRCATQHASEIHCARQQNVHYNQKSNNKFSTFFLKK